MPRNRPFAHRASLIGPLILILIGCAFLVSNFVPDLPVWQFAADYWPFLLIAWGAIRAVEILFRYSQGRPIPLFGISGGEWALAVFLIVFGSALFAGHRIGARFPNGTFTRRGLQLFGEGFSYPVEAHIPSTAAPRLVIEDFSGDVRIVVGGPYMIQVRGQSTVRAFNDADARRFHADSPLELSQQGDHYLLRVRRGNSLPNLAGLSADLDVTVPAGTSIEARSRTGDYDITGISGDVNINADNAGVRLKDIGGKVVIETRRSNILRLSAVKGGVELRGGGEDIELADIAGEVKINGFYRGDLIFRGLAKPMHLENRGTDLRVEKLDGNIRMDRGDFEADGVRAPLTLRSGSTDVKITGSPGPIEIELARGDIKMTAGGVSNSTGLGAWKVHTGAGDVELALLPGFEISAHTGRGEVYSEFPELRTDNQYTNGEIRGTVGKATNGKTPLVDVQTGRGNIRIKLAGTISSAVLERSAQ